jgi:hypothetical protein
MGLSQVKLAELLGINEVADWERCLPRKTTYRMRGLFERWLSDAVR